VHDVWVLDGTMARCSGDGIQINGTQAGTQRIYVGRNHTHHNKQTGMWTKSATDVIFSQNLSHDHHTSNSSLGDCTGGQYDPENAWWIYNVLANCEFGIRIGSDKSGIGQSVFVVGNVILNIHSQGFTPGDEWSNAGIAFWGDVNRVVVNNTLVGVDNGVASPLTYGNFVISNNIISGLSPGGKHVLIDIAPVEMRNNLFDVAPVFGTSAWTCDACKVGDPLFVDAGMADVRLEPGSPAIDSGADEGVYDYFQARFGLDIRAGRPLGGAWDIGAAER
jgi:hypothetical protein